MSEPTIDNIENDEKKRDIIFGACHHNINKMCQLVTEFDSVFNLSPTSRRCSTFDQRLCWSTFVSNHGGRTELKRHLCMSLTSFEKLLSFIRQSLEVDSAMAQLRGGVIIPEIALYCTLRYIAGGSYTDIFFVGISKASFYRVVWKTMYAIVRCENLRIVWPNTKELAVQSAEGFSSISTNRALTECVAVLDGYHMEITTPPKKEVQNVKSYFSGHYQTYGINIQAACDHNCRFLFIGVGGPGVMGDREAIKESGLHNLVEDLPGLLYCIGDCAYTPTEHLIPIYGSDYATKARYDNYNFYASQLRIRIEMSFGLMVKKWGILSRPITIKMQKVKLLICCI